MNSGGSTSNLSCKCLRCGEGFSLKSNRAVSEEFDRLAKPYIPRPEPCCPDPDCGNHGLGIESHRDGYQRFGKTEAGSIRLRCKACGGLFSSPASLTPRQKRPELNAEIFKLLINKLPMRRICEVAGVGPEALYTKLKFLHERCSQFIRLTESPLLSGKPLPPLLISSDRQDYLINWGTSEDRRNVRLHGLGSADNRTGFVFGIHLDFDNSLDPGQVEVEAIDAGDYQLDPVFRRHARLWLKQDWQDPSLQYRRRLKRAIRRGVPVQEMPMEDLPARWDGDDAKLPGQGVKVRSEYTMLAHFGLLAKLTAGSPSVLLYLDQDTGMRSASHVGFRERIRAGTAEAFFVRIGKTLTIDDKKLAIAGMTTRMARARRLHPDLNDHALRVAMMEEAIGRTTVPPRWQDRWVIHPFPSMTEPQKSLCHLTDRDSLTPNQRAAFHLYGSLHGIDRFFMVLRRRCSLLERPIHTASNTGRVWSSGNPYRPGVVEHLLTLMRVAYNYHLVGEDKKTPAMRLGLAKAPWSLAKILKAS